MTLIKNLYGQIKEENKYAFYSLLISIIYGSLYYWSTGYISVKQQSSFSWILVKGWFFKSLKLRAPFLWEPIASLSFSSGLTINIAPLNLLLMAILILLVFLNIFIFILSIKKPKVCQLTSKKETIFALIPALFTGFSCCAPTFIIAFIGIIGTGASTFILVTRWAIPVSLVLLIYGAFKGSKTIIVTSS